MSTAEYMRRVRYHLEKAFPQVPGLPKQVERFRNVVMVSRYRIPEGSTLEDWEAIVLAVLDPTECAGGIDIQSDFTGLRQVAYITRKPVKRGGSMTIQAADIIRVIEYKGTEYTVHAHGLMTPLLRLRYGPSFVVTNPDEGEVAACMVWLQEYTTPRKTLNTRIGSYGLKHVVEHTTPDGYIANGALIEAACRLGLGVVPDGPNSPNAHFRLSYDKKALNARSARFEFGEAP